jgi:hypothetical protein
MASMALDHLANITVVSVARVIMDPPVSTVAVTTVAIITDSVAGRITTTVSVADAANSAASACMVAVVSASMAASVAPTADIMANMATNVLARKARKVRSTATVISTLARMVIMAPDPAVQDRAALANIIADQVDQDLAVPAPIGIVAVIMVTATVRAATTGMRRPMNKPPTNCG